jgi:hypothetical protein
MSRFSALQQIQLLNPQHDHQRIVFLSKCYDFAFDTTRALEFALYRTYCVPSISALLDRTGEFRLRAQKRYDDTDLIVSTLMEWGYESPEGAQALKRMNQIHGRFTIANDDYLYVLSTFVFEPIRWNDRFGWRPLCENERLAYFYFWREVGSRMGIREIPATYEAFEQFNVDFERTRFCFSETNRRVGEATRDLFLGWFPVFLHALVRPAIDALLDDALIDAFGFPRPSPATRALVVGALRFRSRGAPLVARSPRASNAVTSADEELPPRISARRAGTVSGRFGSPRSLDCEVISSSDHRRIHRVLFRQRVRYPPRSQLDFRLKIPFPLRQSLGISLPRSPQGWMPKGRGFVEGLIHLPGQGKPCGHCASRPEVRSFPAGGGILRPNGSGIAGLTEQPGNRTHQAQLLSPDNGC